MESKIKVMMSTEGTYPFHHGGVSTWCDILINDLNPNMDFILYSIIMNPFVTQKFTLPGSTQLIRVPLWGTEEPSEHLITPFSKVYLAKKKTTEKVVKEEFIPLFLSMINEMISYDKDPHKFGKTLFNMYRYFQEYEYKKSFKSEITYNAYKSHILELSKNKDNRIEPPGIYSVIQSLGWIYRFMTILNTPIPKVDVTHSAAAAFCSIPCVLAKYQYNAPFILTEHGVYLREQYLSLSQRKYSRFLSTFLIRMVHSVVSLSYYHADQVSPVCRYNTRWERRFGVENEKINVIYNGVDEKLFTPKVKTNKGLNPTVVSIARIDPVKDIMSLIRTADIVRKEIPNVKFVIYGSVTVPGYYEECLALKDELELGDTFIFAGHTSDVPSAYQTGDIIALSSITEAFPYSVVEAMMTGKPVVSTDVGGIREALGDCGILVPPRSPVAMAKGIITLIKNPELCSSLGEEGRDRALNYFTLRNIQQQYYESYVNLAARSESKASAARETVINVLTINRLRQRLLFEKGCALFEAGLYGEALIQMRKAVNEDISSPAVPVILTKIAEVYNAAGEYDRALIELDRAETLIKVTESEYTA